MESTIRMVALTVYFLMKLTANGERTAGTFWSAQRE